MPQGQSQTDQPPPDLHALIAQFGEELHSAGIQRVVVVGEQWPASAQNALQDWLIRQVKDVLRRDPNRFDLLPDKPGAPMKGFVGPVLDTAGVDAVVSATAYPAEEGIHFTLNAERANPLLGEETEIAIDWDALPPTTESTALIPPEWSKQMGEVRSVPKPGSSTVSKLPACVVCPDPKYPDFARQLKAHGRVDLMVTVGTDGAIHDAQLVRAFGFGLDEAAVANVSRWQLSPALDKQGNPIAIRVGIQVQFRLL